MIIRFAMPQDDLRFTGHNRAHEEYVPGEPGKYSWNASILKADSVPTGLFRTNHYLSSVSLNIFTGEACMHIGVSARAMICFDQRVGTHSPPHYLPSRVPANYVRCFTSMQRYQLNIRPVNTIWLSGRANTVEDAGYSLEPKELKEQLRLTSDMLAENGNISHLTVTFPCCCSLSSVRDGPPVASAILAILTPLNRIKVATTVVFIPAHGLNLLAEDDHCNKPKCLNFAQTIQASMGHLTGEALNFREAAWKRVKAMKHPTYDMTFPDCEGFRDLRRYWFCFDVNDTDSEFERWMRKYIPDSKDTLKQWRKEKKAAGRAEMAKKAVPKCFYFW
ncbi:MAG: hypothetical protein Q9226_008899 [Calogaya cf. arnoldii]